MGKRQLDDAGSIAGTSGTPPLSPIELGKHFVLEGFPWIQEGERDNVELDWEVPDDPRGITLTSSLIAFLKRRGVDVPTWKGERFRSEASESSLCSNSPV